MFSLLLKTEDLRGEMIVPPAKKLEDLIHLAELCVDLLQQNEEHYAEVNSQIHARYTISTKKPPNPPTHFYYF